MKCYLSEIHWSYLPRNNDCKIKLAASFYAVHGGIGWVIDTWDWTYVLLRRVVWWMVTKSLQYLRLHLRSLEMEAPWSSETLLNTYQTTRSFNQEGHKLRHKSVRLRCHVRNGLCVSHLAFWFVVKCMLCESVTLQSFQMKQFSVGIYVLPFIGEVLNSLSLILFSLCCPFTFFNIPFLLSFSK